MSTRHVILGLLRERPGHTYDVAVRFGRRLEPWQVNRGQVYRTVLALQRAGLVEPTARPSESSRSGPAWRVTPAGERELERWFATRSEDVEPLRSELLAKLAIATPQQASELLIALDWYERALTIQLESDIRSRQTNEDAEDGWVKELTDCIADGAILHRDAELAWTRRVRELVEGWAAAVREEERRAGAPRARAGVPRGRAG